jgi:hypothetical protein
MDSNDVRGVTKGITIATMVSKAIVSIMLPNVNDVKM